MRRYPAYCPSRTLWTDPTHAEWLMHAALLRKRPASGWATTDVRVVQQLPYVSHVDWLINVGGVHLLLTSAMVDHHGINKPETRLLPAGKNGEPLSALPLLRIATADYRKVVALLIEHLNADRPSLAVAR